MMYKLEHAKHNERVCRFLSPKQDFADWVITTAFYSAIHFVEYKIFPYKLDGATFENMEQYYMFARKNFPGRDKHGTRVDLVSGLCSDISVAYNWLFSTCNTARYTNFKLPSPREMSNRALEYLKLIRNHCSKK